MQAVYYIATVFISPRFSDSRLTAAASDVEVCFEVFSEIETSSKGTVTSFIGSLGAFDANGVAISSRSGDSLIGCSLGADSRSRSLVEVTGLDDSSVTRARGLEMPNGVLGL